MSGLRIIDLYAVDPCGVLLKRRAPYIDVGLNAFGAAAPDVYAAEVADDILQGIVGRDLHLLGIERGYGPAGIGRILNARGGHNDLFKLATLFAKCRTGK